MAAAPPYRAIIYDYEGVIRLSDAEAVAAIEQAHGLPAGALLAAASEPALWERAFTGLIDDDTWRLATRNALVRAHSDEAAAAVAAWTALSVRYDAAALAVVATVRKQLRTGLIANATTRLEADLRDQRLDQAFAVVVGSARVGFTLPDPRLLRVAAMRLGFPAAACLFVSAAPATLDAARALGMTATAYTDAAALAELLREHGVAKASG